MKPKPKIFFLYQAWQGFVLYDYEILKKNFPIQKLLVYRNFFYKIIPILKRLRKADVIFCWFAYIEALPILMLAKLFRKKIIVVGGGWECANLAEINYGNMRKDWYILPKKILTKVIFYLADKIIAVSRYNLKELVDNCKIPPEKITLIYLGVLCDCCDNICFFKDKKNIVLTVGTLNKENLKRKGLEIFIKTAELLPNIEFIIAGRIDKKVEYLKSNLPINVKLLGYVDRDILHKLYREAKVYLQVSYHEQFGLALAEAMAHECIPVVTNRAAIPEIVGDTGYYVKYNDVYEVVEAIKKAFFDSEKGRIAKKRIIELFPLKKREESLINLIRSLS